MIRRAAIIVVALALNPVLLRAQATVFTIDVSSAELHEGPSTVNPVIGHAPRGTVLTVARNLGSWVRVQWPDAENGIAYVHVTSGHIGPLKGAVPAATASRQSSTATAAARTLPPPTPAPGREPVERRDPISVTPATHTFGVGGLVGSVDSFGATVRAWHRDRLALQVGIMRNAFGSDIAAGRVTSVQVEPGVIYALFDHVSDYVWIRPYVGTVLSFDHQTLNVSGPVAQGLSPDNSLGFRAFGGAEFTFAAAPRFGLSADLGYRRMPTPFPGFDPGPLTATVGGHWYIK